MLFRSRPTKLALGWWDSSLLERADMTIRHAAALALVGWYLMIPPATPVVEQEPWPWWWCGELPCIVKGPFPSADDCDRERQALVGREMRHSLNWPPNQASLDYQDSAKAQCLSEQKYRELEKLREFAAKRGRR